MTCLWDERHDEEHAREYKGDCRGRDQRLGAVHVKVLRPERQPPGVRRLLVVEDAEGMPRCAQNGNAECHNETGDDGLRHVEGCRVDLHVDYCSFREVVV